jgi:hypothetical protein
MIKYALMSFQFFGLLFLGLFSSNEPVVDHQTPKTIYPGEKKEVTISIDKTAFQGFGKLEIILPSGLVATAGKTEGASFTFHEQKARFVWMTMPTERSFKVTYYLETTDSSAKNVDIRGTFSYIQDNRRVDYTIPLRTVAIRRAGLGDESTPPAAAAPVAVASGEMRCTRTITPLSATEFRVDIRLENNMIEGFAKVIENVPNNCKTEKIQDAGSVVTQEKNSVKFVWFEIPKSPVVDLSYKISCLTPPSSPLSINGKLSYVLGGAPKELPILTRAEGEPVVAQKNTPAKEPATQPVTPPKTSGEEKTASAGDTKGKSNPKAPVKQESSGEEAITKASPEKGVSYKVQILAAHKVVNKSYFQQKHGYSGAINIENHEGWVKYTTGRYAEYKQARDAREQITRDHGSFPGPFVTAYHDGARITVQEALLISQQQWIK